MIRRTNYITGRHGSKKMKYSDRVYTRDLQILEDCGLRTKTVIQLQILYSDDVHPAVIFK
jgi:hypothetical protein